MKFETWIICVANPAGLKHFTSIGICQKGITWHHSHAIITMGSAMFQSIFFELKWAAKSSTQITIV